MESNMINGVQSTFGSALLRAATFPVGMYATAPVSSGVWGELCPQAGVMTPQVVRNRTAQKQHLIQNDTPASVALTGDGRFAKAPPGSQPERLAG